MNKGFNCFISFVFGVAVVSGIASKFYGIDMFGDLKNLINPEKELIQVCAGIKSLEDATIIENEVDEEEGTIITIAEVSAQFETIDELVAVKRDYDDVAFYEDCKHIPLIGIKCPGTSNSLTMSYTGSIRAGYRLDDIEVKLQDKKIVVTLPKAEIISNDIKIGECVYDDAIFNKVPADEIAILIDDAKSSAERSAIKAGIFKEADKNARKIITNTFSVFSEYGYSVEFVDTYEKSYS